MIVALKSAISLELFFLNTLNSFQDIISITKEQSEEIIEIFELFDEDVVLRVGDIE